MTKIIENQTLEIDNLLSYRSTIKMSEIENIGKKMEEAIALAGARTCDKPITATYGLSNGLIDMELLIPINKKIKSIDQFVYKDKLRIINAVVAIHKGSTSGLQQTCNDLNEYMLTNKLMPITAGYNVTKKINPLDINDIEVHVYVGINPNII